MKPMLYFIDVEVDQGWFAIEEKLPNGVAVGPADGGAGNEGLDIGDEHQNKEGEPGCRLKQIKSFGGEEAEETPHCRCVPVRLQLLPAKDCGFANSRGVGALLLQAARVSE